MRQRLGLASALLGEPELLGADEPANGLDPEGMRWLRDFLRTFASNGGSVLVSSHVLAEVDQPVHRVVIINHGRFVAEARARRDHGAGDVCGARADPRRPSSWRDCWQPTGSR